MYTESLLMLMLFLTTSPALHLDLVVIKDFIKVIKDFALHSVAIKDFALNLDVSKLYYWLSGATGNPAHSAGWEATGLR